jgi:putative phage-type endonuclease
MGENPWKSADRLMREKLGETRSFAGNAAMRRGNALEPEARRRYERLTGLDIEPACLQSTLHDWQRASVDGLARDGTAVVEIKCGDSVYEKTASQNDVPSYYVGQLQHILSVTGFKHIDFFCYLPSRPHVRLRVARNDGYIEKLIIAEHRFWQQLSLSRS